MQTNFRNALLTVFSVLIFASCTKTNKEGKFIPKNAAIAVLVNGASLSTKLPWNDVKQNELFKQMYADTSIPAFVKQALDNPDNSGIDTKTDLLFFAQKDTIGGIVAFTGTIKDAEKFRLFTLDVTKGGVQSERDGVNYVSKYPVCVGWNKERFVYLADAPQMNMQNAMMHDSNSVSPAKSRDIGAACKNIFDLKEDNSLAKNEKFTELVKKTGDIHFWMNSEELYKGTASMPAMVMVNISKLYEGSFTAATVNFENGKILMDAKSYAGKEMTDLYKKYGGKNIDEDMIKRLPSKDVAAVFAMSFKPEGIKEFLKLLGVEAYANMGLAVAGFSMDDFIKANKGDILIALTDLKHKPSTDTSAILNNAKTDNVEPDIIFASSIGDKEAFNFLIKAGEKLGKDVPAGIPIAYNSDGKLFAIGNSKENIDKYFANKGTNNFDFLSKINGNPFGGYINLQFILKAVETNFSKDSTAKVIYDASIKMWDNVYMKGGNFEGGGITQTMEINLMDKSTNSLKQLNQYLGLLSKIKMEQDKKRKMSDMSFDEFDKDKMVAPPASPAVKEGN
ncbi:DUF4836 family protein [Ferruginibacter sp.]